MIVSIIIHVIFLMCICGNVCSALIAGGVEVFDYEFPYVVNIQEEGKHCCAGVLIKFNRVLSSCHCLADFKNNITTAKNFKSFSVTGGTVEVSQKRKRQLRSAIKIKLHPQCAQRLHGYVHDLAVVFLMECFIFSPALSVVIIPYNLDKLTNNFVKKSTLCDSVGWGWPDKYNNSIRLYKLKVRLFNWDFCEAAITYFYGNKSDLKNFRTSQICAFGPPKKDTCKKAYGGPLVCNDHFIGILSWDPDCSESGVPITYSKIDTFFLQIYSSSNKIIQAITTSYIVLISFIFLQTYMY